MEEKQVALSTNEETKDHCKGGADSLCAEKRTIHGKQKKRFLIQGAIFLTLFALLIILIKCVDVQAIGPMGTSIGLAGLNKAVFELFGVNLIFYTITDWLGLVGIAVAAVFGVTGLCMWIRRKRFLKVDAEILLLGAFYIIVIAAYVFFEFNVISYRPVILYKNPEASFPSSHTMIIVCIMQTAAFLFQKYFKKKSLRITATVFCYAIIAVTVIGRLIAGVHWFTDILGGLLLAESLISFYFAALNAIKFS